MPQINTLENKWNFCRNKEVKLKKKKEKEITFKTNVITPLPSLRISRLGEECLT